MEIGHKPVTGLSPHDTGQLLLEQMYLARFPEPLPPILKGPLGKPYFAHGGVHFSITHTPHHAFCVLSDRPVGIDAEELDRPMNLRLAEKILSPKEQERYASCPDKRDALLRFWVLKEAQGKCTGEGLRIYPTHTDFSPDDPRVTTMHGCLVAVITED